MSVLRRSVALAALILSCAAGVAGAQPLVSPPTLGALYRDGQTWRYLLGGLDDLLDPLDHRRRRLVDLLDDRLDLGAAGELKIKLPLFRVRAEGGKLVGSGPGFWYSAPAGVAQERR